MAKLCILCCYSYQSGGDGGDPNFERILKGNLQKFCKEVKSDWNGLVNSLKTEWNEVSICGDCLASVDKAVEVRRQMEEMEGDVRRLQRELLGKMRKLKHFVEDWREELRRMEGIVKGGDLGALESRRRPKRRRLQGKEEDGVVGFRRRISEVALEVQAFCGDLEVKTGGLGVFGRTWESSSKSKMEETEVLTEVKPKPKGMKEEKDDYGQDDEDDNFGLWIAEDNPLYLSEVNLDNRNEKEEEETFSEAQDSNINDSDEEETSSTKKDKLMALSSYKYQIIKRSRVALLKTLDTTNWSPFKLRIITRLLKRNKNSFTAPPPQDSTSIEPPPGHNLSFNPGTDKLTVNSIEVLLVSDVTIPGGGYLQCSLCNYIAKPSFIQKKNIYTDEYIDKAMSIHVSGYHLDSYRCPICLKCLVNPKLYREHLKRHQGHLNCPDCGKPYSSTSSLRAHQWTHFSEEEKQAAVAAGEQDPRETRKNSTKTSESGHVCVTCGKSFIAQRNLRHHEETHEESREMIVCPQCGKHLLKKSYGTYHRYNCPGSVVDQNRVHCLLCDMRFKTKEILKQHMKRMHSQNAQERNWRCEVCSKGFKSRKDLIMHQKTHGEGRIWSCEKGCGKEFNVKRYWSSHVKRCKGIVK